MKTNTPKQLLSLFTFLLGFYLSGNSQDIIINEYFNTADQNDEWTELVVVKDNLSLTDWYLGDNNTATSNWQPKLQFTDHPLWKNLRAGTIIQIDHATNLAGCNDAEDVDKSDGFIRVCCRKSAYFVGGSNSTLFLADDGDFVQIVDPTGKMVHAIGHSQDPGTSVEGGPCLTTSSKWTNIGSAQSAGRPCGNFLFYRFNMASPTSLYVKAGLLSDFSKLMQDAANPYIDTSDTPFEGIGNAGPNAAWVVDQRKPQIAAQNVCATNAGGSPTTVIIHWDPATDPFPSDNVIGYMILRNTVDDFPLPTQGVQYTPGQTLGTGNQTSSVIGIINNSQTTTFSHNPGAGTFFYRIFAFRYVNTPSFGGHFTRGRTYNTEQFIKVNAGGPVEVALHNDTLCGAGTAKLTAFAPVGSSVSWYSAETGGTLILANSDTLKIPVTSTTSFWAEVNSSALCTIQRFEVKALIQPFDFQYTAADSVCEGVPAYLAAQTGLGWAYDWKFINPPAGLVTSRHDSSGVYLNIPTYSDSRTILYSIQVTNEKGCLGPLKSGFLYTVPFDPSLASEPAAPVEGEVFKVNLENKPGQSGMVAQWFQTGGILIDSTRQNCKVSTLDSITVSAIIEQLLPTDAQFCKVSRTLKIMATPIPDPILPAKPITNLILEKGTEKNQILDFDTREVKNLEVFDRWGKKVHTASDYKNDWEGSDLQAGTYFFKADTKEPDGQNFEMKTGWVLIVK